MSNLFDLNIRLDICLFVFSDKKPLVRRDSPEEVKAKVRRGSQKRQANPMKALAEFQAAADEVI